jgi:hypothetical protein
LSQRRQQSTLSAKLPVTSSPLLSRVATRYRKRCAVVGASVLKDANAESDQVIRLQFFIEP